MKCLKEFDARALSHDALEQLRRAAVKRVEAGESPEFVATGLGINRRTMYRWLEAFHYGGADALAAKPIAGAPRKLDAKQMEWISRTVRTKNPLQLKFDYALWTLAMIRELIRRRFEVNLSEVSVGRLMRRLGLTRSARCTGPGSRTRRWSSAGKPSSTRRSRRGPSGKTP